MVVTWRADLTAINGDPLSEISDVHNVVAVYHDGHLVVDRRQPTGVQTAG
jgi:imidazolonepropionase-like amidohydrolase